MKKQTKLKYDFKEDLFLENTRQPYFSSEECTPAIELCQKKWRAAVNMRPNDWLTAWQIKNE